jgi:peptidoglycan/LPS O-acetylase OafA/YrhL
VTALGVSIALYLLLGRGATPGLLLALVGLLGLSSGYWAIFVTVGAEQFGTNIRATVATTVPNFVRGMVVVVTMAFQALRPSLGLTGAAAAVGAVCVALALAAGWRLQESFGRDLDFFEG